MKYPYEMDWCSHVTPLSLRKFWENWKNQNKLGFDSQATRSKGSVNGIEG